MKQYTVKAGTPAKLITKVDGKDVETKDWTVRRDLTFFEVLLDPIRLYNNRAQYDSNSLAVQMVSRGYALFGGKDGNDPHAKHTLAVLYYDHVELK